LHCDGDSADALVGDGAGALVGDGADALVALQRSRGDMMFNFSKFPQIYNTIQMAQNLKMNFAVWNAWQQWRRCCAIRMATVVMLLRWLHCNDGVGLGGLGC
jgi:hypothetical protein